MLEEIALVCQAGYGHVDTWIEVPADENPAVGVVEAVWPFDPLGERRAVVEAAAGRVRTAMAARKRKTRWSREADLLLAERDELLRKGLLAEVAVPSHLSVSHLVTLKKDPSGLARSLRRPLPKAPTHTRGAAPPSTAGSRSASGRRRCSIWTKCSMLTRRRTAIWPRSSGRSN